MTLVDTTGRPVCFAGHSVAVSASHTMVEIGAEGRVQIGDEVTVFDWEDGSRPEDLAEAFGGSVYDL